MSRFKGFVVALLWVAVPVAIGMGLLQLEQRGTGTAVLEGLLDRTHALFMSPAVDPSQSTEMAQATGVDPDRPGDASPDPVPAVAPAPRSAEPIAAPARAAVSCATDTPDGLAIGDTISVRYFEDVTGADANSGVTTTFERRDLAAQVQVRRDGTVSLPALGRLSAFAKGPACLETELARAATERLGFSGRAVVDFASRPATLVRGEVLRPGSYAWDPGLTPARLVTLAGHPDAADRLGGIERGALDAQRADLDMVRADLELRAARLRAASTDADALDLPAEDARRVARMLGARAIEAETAVLRSDRAAAAERRAFAAERDAQTRARVTRLEATLAATEDELAFLQERRDALSGLVDRGSITPIRLEDMTRSILSLERERLERSGALEDARVTGEAARHADRVAEADRERDRMHALQETELELRRTQAQLDGLALRIGAGDGGAERTLRFSVERLTPDGPIRRDIDPDETLMPGDLITVALPEPRSEPTQ